ncbi:cache domain-containing protein, partial [bacterium]|nr:cache domain-containing protein [bacterium]
KISFIKEFKSLNWLIGSGFYSEDVEKQLKDDILSDISKIRFGKEGYIFIDRLNGDALVTNGKLLNGTKKLWELFGKEERIKSVFEKEYDAALKPKGDYIFYSWEKLTDSNKESPKASFIYGITEWQWIVGAGVYLDDVEADIAVLQKIQNKRIKAKILHFVLIDVGIVVLFLLLFSWLTHRFKKDFNLFAAFFNKAAHSDEEINRDLVQFVELDRLAKNANKMLRDRIHAQQVILDEKEKLFITIESIGDGLITTDLSSRIELMNVVAEKLTGWRVDEAQGKPLREVFSIVNSKTKEEAENPVERVLKNGKTVGLANDTVLISRNGTEYQISDSAAPIKM